MAHAIISIPISILISSKWQSLDRNSDHTTCLGSNINGQEEAVNYFKKIRGLVNPEKQSRNVHMIHRVNSSRPPQLEHELFILITSNDGDQTTVN